VIATPARKAYLRSSALQRVIHEQVEALDSGASCSDVHRALRSVDFPIPVLPQTAR
jgi:hypothetical protein